MITQTSVTAKKKRVERKASKDTKILIVHGEMIRRMMDHHRLSGKSPLDLARDIPYLLPDFFKGTQVVQVRLVNTVALNTVAATAYSSVTNLQASQYNNFSDFAGIFDEYRVLNGGVSYFPQVAFFPAAASTLFGSGAAAIDYSISAAFTSLVGPISHDNMQIFDLVSVGRQEVHPKFGSAYWKVEVEKQPDQDWLPVTNSTTPWAYWKPYVVAANSPFTGLVGQLVIWQDFQFRGLAA